MFYKIGTSLEEADLLSLVWYFSLNRSIDDDGSNNDSSLRLLKRSPLFPANLGLTDDLSSTTELSLWQHSAAAAVRPRVPTRPLPATRWMPRLEQFPEETFRDSDECRSLPPEDMVIILLLLLLLPMLLEVAMAWKAEERSSRLILLVSDVIKRCVLRHRR